MTNFFPSNAVLKALTICCCFPFIFFQKTNAQSPVLTDANLSPKKGDIFVFKYCKTNKFDTGFAGANKTWDYSYLKDSISTATNIKVTDEQTCILPSQTPFAGFFPKAKIATTHTLAPENHYDYYSGGNFFAYWGYVLGSLNNVYTKAAALTPKYPFSYGSSFFSTSKFTDQYNIIYNGKDSLYADGYGTLKLPNRTISDVVKIKQVHSYTSISYQTLTRVESYVFVTPNYHAGLLNLSHTKITSLQNNATLSDYTLIWYAQNTSGLPLQTIALTAAAKDELSTKHSIFSLSPNPAKDFVNIVSSADVSNVQLRIAGINGETLYASKQNFIAGQKVSIALSQLPNQVLMITVGSNNNYQQFKIVKE